MSEENKTTGIPLPGDASENTTESRPEFLSKDEWFDIDISADLLDFSEPYRPPRYTMERDGVPFADVGELHIISGKPGHGKTGLMSQLMATCLCGKHGNTIRRDVPHRVDDHEEMVPVRVLYIDTEQGKDDTIAIKNRVCSMAGINYTQPCEQFAILRLRDTEEAKDRWRKIMKAIHTVRPTDIFLDGMLDIVKDYNDQVECQPIVRKCMMTATEYDASLWAVLHENPMVDKLVGTLGSITQRKVSEIFTVTKVKQADLKPNEKRAELPEIYFKVKQVKARGRDVADWLFEYRQNAGGWGQPFEICEQPAQDETPKNEDDDTLKAVVKCLLEFLRPPMSEFYSNIVASLKKKMHVGEAKAKTYFSIANDKGVFNLPVSGRYTLNVEQCEALLNDLPFAAGNNP